jgi:hypothetical protein
MGPSTQVGGPIFVSLKEKKKHEMKKIQKTLAVLFVFSSSLVFAQERPMHEVYSMMVYNFIKYVQWPDHSESGEFVIGIVGNAEVFGTLNAWYGGKPRGGKT